MKQSLKESIMARVADEPMARKLGLRLVDVSEGYARVEMDVTPDLANLFEMCHGAAIFSLVDEAFEVAGNTHDNVAVAMSVTIHYLEPPKFGSRLTGEAREIYLSDASGHYEIRVTDDTGRLIATCQAQSCRTAKPLPFFRDSLRGSVAKKR